MLRSILIAFWRSFTRHPLYGALNLLGLSLGIAVFIALSLLVRFETHYEDWSPERDRIYTFGTRYFFPGMTDEVRVGAMGGLTEELKASYPQLVTMRDWSNSVTVHKGAEVYSEQIELVDPEFLTFFAVPIVAGEAATALNDPGHVVLSEEMARKYFGTTQAMGKTLTLSDEEGRRNYIVSGVMKDLPKNTDLKAGILRRLTPQRAAMETDTWHHWGSSQLMAFVKFQSPAEAKSLQAQMNAFTDRQVGDSFGPGTKGSSVMNLMIVPLGDIHLLEPKQKAAIFTLGLVGVVALVLALINYVNLATARAGLRAREVAVRKTLGARPAALRLQFLGEAVLTLLLAFLIGLSLVELTLPLINATGGLSLSLDYAKDFVWLLALLGIVMAAGIVAALYPSFALSAFKPAQVLASSRTPAGGRMGVYLREGLVILQFAAVVVAFTLMLGFIRQIDHIQTADLGFKREGLLLVNSIRDTHITQSQRDAFLAATRALPNVSAASIANAIPGDQSTSNNSNIVRPGQTENLTESPTVNWSVVGPDYFELVGAKLIAGRLYDPRFAEDQMWEWKKSEPNRITNVIISRLAAKRMGFASPEAAIGQPARFSDHQVRIVGVVEDMRFYHPAEVIPAKIYLFDRHASHAAVGFVRYAGVSEAVMRERLRMAWRGIAPDVPFEVVSASDNLDKYYKPERDRSNLFGVGAGVAALIGCIGLYGMAAFNTSRRAREIGLRKVLGASRGRVVRLLTLQFLRPVLITSVIAWPLAWLALSHWLSQFDDAIGISPLFFVIATAAALAIALGTVGGLALASASTEPGKALRHQ